MRQALRPGVLGKPRGSVWRGRCEGGLGWGTHVNPWLFHFNVWQNSLQIKKINKFKKNKKKKRRFSDLSLLFFGTLHSDGYYLPITPLPVTLFFSQLFVRSTQTTILPCCTLFSPLGMVLITTSCTMLRTFFHSSSGTLSDLNPWIYLTLLLYNHKGFMSYPDGLVVFPAFFNLSMNFAIRSSWSGP